jgi:hypothetical protein
MRESRAPNSSIPEHLQKSATATPSRTPVRPEEMVATIVHDAVRRRTT